MANTEKWRQCSRCGHQFCYVCGLVWDTCDCALWDKRRLVARVNEEVEDEVAPGANINVRRRAFNDIYRQLQGHERIPASITDVLNGLTVRKER
ncbi:Zinc finger C6HC-type [Penicillium sp. IBT 35674x]|nr:Zinc finger C6HC-type [Penicillium sp. IBT 35674x]